MCSNALEIALDENPFDAKKLENMIIKSLGTNEGCNDEENASALNTVTESQSPTGKICRRSCE